METLYEKMSNLEKGWLEALKLDLMSDYMEDLARFVAQERKSGVVVYPPKECVFNAFQHTPFDKVKVVLMGQDPYHGKEQANGLCFSVPSHIKVPPSLRNIYKEMGDDLGISTPDHGDLTVWGQQGVLLLNATLTVRESTPKSHYGKGWECFTDSVIEALCKRDKPVVFLLWGKSAQEKCQQVIQKYPKVSPYVLTAAHPSPYSAYNGFFGCRHFSKTNALLEQLGESPVNWKVPNKEESTSNLSLAE